MDKRREEVVIVKEWWPCGIEHHRHTTQEIAQRCLDKQAKPKKSHNKWTKQKRLEAIALRRGGKTYREIGAVYGITAQRARAVVLVSEWYLRNGRL